MKWTAVHIAAARATQHQRRGSPPQVVRLCDHIADLVQGAADKVHELKFSDRTHSGKRCAKCCADNRRLRDRSVNYTLGTEAVNKAIGDFERSAVNTDVFT